MLKNSYNLQFGESPYGFYTDVKASPIADTDNSVGFIERLNGSMVDSGAIDMYMNQLFKESANSGQGMSWDAFLHYCSVLGIFDKSENSELDKDISTLELERIYLTSKKVIDSDNSVLYYDDFRMVALPKIAQKKKILLGSLLRDILNHVESRNH